MSSFAVLGLQWGDEGKGKVVDALASKVDVLIRPQGGQNAGHTVCVDGTEYRMHLLPSGALHPHVQCWIGPGTVLHPPSFLEELKALKAKGVELEGRLQLSLGLHIIFPYHFLLDKAIERRKGALCVGTTHRGIGPALADKALRLGITLKEMLDAKHFKERLEALVSWKNTELQKVYSVDPVHFSKIYEEYCDCANALRLFSAKEEVTAAFAIEQGKSVLLEGAQGTLLDTTFGSYPFVTSSSTLFSGLCCGAGVPPARFQKIIGVVKAYTTRVGQGPFPTELSLEEQSAIEKAQPHLREVGTTTGRKRRIGWLDLPLLRFAIALNGVTHLAITKVDILSGMEEFKVCVGYRWKGKLIKTVPSLSILSEATAVYETIKGWQAIESVNKITDFPKQGYAFLCLLQKWLERPIMAVSYGPSREEMITIGAGELE